MDKPPAPAKRSTKDGVAESPMEDYEPEQVIAGAALDASRAAQIGERLYVWFRTNGRSFPWREWTDEYRVAVVESLLQRTTATAVANYIETFLLKYPSWGLLLATPHTELAADLERLGLQERRAAHLHRLAKSRLQDGPLNEQSPGVGQYLARALTVVVRGQNAAMVDSNFIRVVRRAFAGDWKSEYRTDARLQALSLAIVRGGSDPRATNWAVLDLGAVICKPRAPACSACPINHLCVTARGSRSASGSGSAVASSTESLPVRTRKRVGT